MARPPRTALLAAIVAVALAAGGLWAVPATQAMAEIPRAVTAVVSKKPKITSNLSDATISRYGTRTSKTFRIKATGSKLRYRWQYRTASGKTWRNIAKATTASYRAKATRWKSGTRFRVVVTGTRGRLISKPAKLTVLAPTKTPAADAERAFGLTGLRQGVDLSAWQYTPSAKVNHAAIRRWAGSNGLTILRNGSGARPIKQAYTDTCTDRRKKTGSRPVVADCAYATLADRSTAKGLDLGHYWFNGWISSIDNTKKRLFSGDYTPTDSARQFVRWLLKNGNYTTKSTDPLVLDVEAGSVWTKTSGGKKYRRKLRAWKPAEAAEFLTTVSATLTKSGYQANLYVYMSANTTKQRTRNGTYAWAKVADLARLWVADWGTDNGRIPDRQPAVGPWRANGGWSIWQYSSNARVSGSGVGALDGDIAKADAWQPR